MHASAGDETQCLSYRFSAGEASMPEREQATDEMGAQNLLSLSEDQATGWQRVKDCPRPSLYSLTRGLVLQLESANQFPQPLGLGA